MGIPLFALLYLIAAFYYPGGSQFDTDSKGFSWINNYWCNLLNEQALNGEPNIAKPVAIAAMTVLCMTLAFFWYKFPASIEAKSWIKQVVRYCGLLAMLTVSFLGVFDHDGITKVASLFGVLSVTGMIYMLLRQNWRMLFWMGVANVLLVGVNNLFYYTDGLLRYLPIVQKLAFVFVLLWIWLITNKVRLRES